MLTRFEHGAVVCGLHEPVIHVARRMRDCRVGCVVVTRDARPIGIVTDRDLALRVVAEGLDPKVTPVSDVATMDVLIGRTSPRRSGVP